MPRPYRKHDWVKLKAEFIKVIKNVNLPAKRQKPLDFNAKNIVFKN